MIQLHIITGFLGVGKTSCIQHLIQHKPSGERWAVLVNEYGQQGIDGSLYDSDQIIVKQVAGGCACCAALLPFQTALNELIRFEKPDRILIEPSGLGHVDNIAKRLQEDDYQKVLTLNGIVCVIDPRHLSQPKYRYHELYLRQLFAADKFVANKTDLATPQDMNLFDQLVSDFKRPNVSIEHGQLRLADIEQPRIERENPMQIQAGEQAEFYTHVEYTDCEHWHIDSLISSLQQFKFMRIKALLVQGSEIISINMSEGECRKQVFQKQKLQQQSVVECIHDAAIDTEKLKQILQESRHNE